MFDSGETMGVIVVQPSGGLVHYTSSAAKWLSDREPLRIGDTWYDALPEPVRLRLHREWVEWVTNRLEGDTAQRQSASSPPFCFDSAAASRQVTLEFAVPVSDSSQQDLLIATVCVSGSKPPTGAGGSGADVGDKTDGGLGSGLGGSSGGGCEHVCAQMYPSSEAEASPGRMGSHLPAERKPSGDADKETGTLDIQCTLLASMSHEMQQPIYAMQNFMFAARQYLKLGQLDLVEQMLTKIEGQLVWSTEIGDRLRQVSVRSKHFRRPTDVHKLIAACGDIAQMHADDAQALLRMDLQATKTAVLCDAAQIQQVILNLIRNSADSLAATDSQDRSLVIETACDNHKIRIRVIDSGPGIETVDQQRIFDRFFTTKETGLGIGLPFCRSVIGAHGGDLALHENRPGRVVFQIELPLSE